MTTIELAKIATDFARDMKTVPLAFVLILTLPDGETVVSSNRALDVQARLCEAYLERLETIASLSKEEVRS